MISFGTIFIHSVEVKEENPPTLSIELLVEGELHVSPMGTPNGLQGVAGPSREIHVENGVIDFESLNMSNSTNLTNWSSSNFEMSSTTAAAMLPILRQLEEEEAEELRKAEEQRKTAS